MKKIIHYFFLILTGFYTVQAQNPAAGTFDSTFNSTGIFLSKHYGYDISFQHTLILPDNKLLFTGHVNDSAGFDRTLVVRLLPDGTPDPTFSDDGRFILSQHKARGTDSHLLTDGRILVCGQGLYPNSMSFLLLKPDGTLDSTYNANGVKSTFIPVSSPNIIKTVLLPDGKVVVIGQYFENALQQWRAFVSRINSDGELDTAFGENGFRTVPDGNNLLDVSVSGGGVRDDGKILLTGRIGANPALNDWYLVRFTPDGDLDNTFGAGGILRKSMGNNYSESCNAVLFLENGKFIGGGDAAKSPGFHFTIARFNDDGSLDSSFGFNGKSQIAMDCCYSTIFDLQMQADGKIVACGYASEDNAKYDFAVARFKANGLIDQTFGHTGKLILKFDDLTDTESQRAVSIGIQPDHKIVIAGYTDYNSFSGWGTVIRINPGTVTVGAEVLPQNNPDGITISPNPVPGDLLHLSCTLEEPGRITTQIFDLNGKQIEGSFSSGYLTSGSQNLEIPLPENMASGVYILRLDTPGGIASIRFVKLP